MRNIQCTVGTRSTNTLNKECHRWMHTAILTEVPRHLHLCACVGCVQPTGWGLSAALCIPLSMPLLSSSLSSLSFTALHAHLVHTHKAQQRSPFFLGVFPEFHCVTPLGQHLSLDADIFGNHPILCLTSLHEYSKMVFWKCLLRFKNHPFSFSTLLHTVGC